MDGMTFSAIQCAEAATICLQFFSRSGDFRPIPARIHALIAALNISTFAGRPTDDATRIEMVNCITKAVKPWHR